MTMMRGLGWWYWLVTVGFLGAGLSGRPQGFFPAILLCAVQIAPPCKEVFQGMPVERVQG